MLVQTWAWMARFSQVGGANVEKNSNLAKIVLRVIAVAASVALLFFSLLGPVGMLHVYASNAIAFDGTNTPTSTDTPVPTDTPAPTITPTSTNTPTPTPTPRPTYTPRPVHTPTPMLIPTHAPESTPADTPATSLISTPMATTLATATANPSTTRHLQGGQTPSAGVAPVGPSQNGGMRSTGKTSGESSFPVLPIVIGGLVSLCVLLAICGMFLRRSQSAALRGLKGTRLWSRAQVKDEKRDVVINSISPAETIQMMAFNYSSPSGETLAGNYTQGTFIEQQTTANLKAVGRINSPVQQISAYPKDMHMPAVDDPRLVDYLKRYALGRLVVPPEQRETENA